MVFGAECDALGMCPVCKVIEFADCPCPGPTQCEEFEYRERNGRLEAREWDS